MHYFQKTKIKKSKLSKTVEKPKLADKKISFIELPKTATKLSKQPEIITQQQGTVKEIQSKSP